MLQYVLELVIMWLCWVVRNVLMQAVSCFCVDAPRQLTQVLMLLLVVGGDDEHANDVLFATSTFQPCVPCLLIKGHH